jgi:succinylglutamate desuccinylase
LSLQNRIYTQRVIGRYHQGKRGPLLVVLGAMHGNEPAGVKAIEEIVHLLKIEKEKNPDFVYNGSFIGMIANLDALNENKRFINKDLNRSWSFEAYKEILNQHPDTWTSEQQQVYGIIEALRQEINESRPDMIVVLDLHTTSAHGGIFSIVTDDPLSEKLAIELHAPVIKGMLQGINGSSIHFFHGKNMGISTTAIGFECGQHEDEFSYKRGVAAIVNCMRTIGSVKAQDVENRHDEILIAFSKDLPKVSFIIDKYKIKHSGNFVMQPGFRSFDKVHTGQLLAYDGDQAVYCPIDSRILMPFYQKVGEEGFFLIKEKDAL